MKPSLFRTLGCLARPLAAAAALAALHCGDPSPADNNPDPQLPPLTVEPDVAPQLVSSEHTLTIDPSNADFVAHKTQEPVASPITLTGGGGSIKLRALAKKVPMRPDILWVELYFENTGLVGLRDVAVTVSDVTGGKLLDLTNEPFSEDDTRRKFALGGLAAEGIGRLVMGVPVAAVTTIKLALTGTTTKRVATSSTPIQVSPDGAEVWVAWPDADRVAVLDAKSHARLEQLTVPGRPSSVAITPDGKLVAVASAAANTVTIIDRATRQVLQTLGEGDGIGREPRHIVASPDGARLFVSAYVGDSVTSLGRHGTRYVVEESLHVERRPTALSVGPDGKLLVAHYLPRGKVTANVGHISVLSTAPLTMVREAVINDRLNLTQSQCIADLLHVPPALFTSEGTATQLSGAFLNPSGSLAFVPGTRVGPVPIWERGPHPQDISPFVLPRPAELAAGFFFVVDSRSLKDTDMLQLPGQLDPPDGKLPYLKCARIEYEAEVVSRNVLTGMPNQQVNTAAATPTAATGLSESGIVRHLSYTRGGRLVLAVANTSDELLAYDALTLTPRTQRHTQLSGNNPVGIALSPDGNQAFVVYANSTFVSVLDTSAYAQPGKLPDPTYLPYEYRDVPEFPAPPGLIFTGKRLVRYIDSAPDRPSVTEVAQVPIVDQDPMPAELRRGKVLFSSGNPDKHPKLSASRLGACASCHPDGANDGTLWPTMEGERRTLSLRGGVSGRGWLHISGTHRDASEFADTIVRERLGGNLPPGDLNALARYIAVGIAKLQAPKVSAEQAARGKTLFQANCSGCHAGEQLTSGRPLPSDPLGGGDLTGPGLFDIGTATDNAFVTLPKAVEMGLGPLEKELIQKLRGDRDLGTGDRVQEILDFRQRPDRKRGQFKAPSLINVWDSVVFFHDGRYESLGEVVKFFNDKLMLNLPDSDQAALVEYLKTL